MAKFSEVHACLRPEVILNIRKSKSLKLNLMLHFNISNSTLQSWLDNNKNNFTQYACLLILKEHLGINDVSNLMSVNQNI